VRVPPSRPFRPVSSAARASRLHRDIRGFESLTGYGCVAHWAERLRDMQKAVGSIPAAPTSPPSSTS
jgi:hypothetical protein